MIEELQNFIWNYWESVKSNDLFQAGIGVATLSYIGYNIKPLLFYIWGRIKRYFTNELHCDDLSVAGFHVVHAIDEYILTRKKKSQRVLNYKIFYKPIDTFNSNPFSSYRNERAKLSKEGHSDSFLIWYKLRPISVTRNRTMLDNAASKGESYRESYVLKTIFGRKILDSFLQEAINNKEKKKSQDIEDFDQSRISGKWIYRITNVGRVKSYPIPGKRFTNIFYSEKERLIQDLNVFLGSYESHNKLGIPMRRTICLEGPPGTGKTSTTYAIAHYLKKDLHVVNLGDFRSGEDLLLSLDEIPDASIIVWEDLDTYMKGRMTNDPDKTGVPFSVLLNVFDGAYGLTNSINIITTNHIELFDDALLRKGRIDEIYTIDYPTLKDVLDLVDYYYSEDDIYSKEKYQKLKDLTLREQLNLPKFNIPMSAFQDKILNCDTKSNFLDFVIELM